LSNGIETGDSQAQASPESREHSKDSGGKLAPIEAAVSIGGLIPDRDAELKSRKLELEILQLKRWWLQPSALSGFGTMLLGVIGLVTAAYVGYFDKARLDFERSNLVRDIQTLELERKGLEDDLERVGRGAAQIEQRVRDAQDRVTESEMLRNQDREVLEQEASSLRSSLQRYADRIAFLEEQLVLQRNSASEAQTLARKAQAESAEIKEKAESMNQELLLLPATVGEAQLAYSESDTAMRGFIAGLNLGEEPGSIEVRVVRFKWSLTGKKKYDPASMNGGLLQFKLDAQLISSWTSRRIAFMVSVEERNRILQLRGETVGDRESNAYLSGNDIEIQVRVETKRGLKSEWTEARFFHSTQSIPG
jgi:hypothetical protein